MLSWLTKKSVSSKPERRAKDIGLPELPTGYYWKITKDEGHYVLWLQPWIGTWKDLSAISYFGRSQEELATTLVERAEEIVKRAFPQKYGNDPLVGKWL